MLKTNRSTELYSVKTPTNSIKKASICCLLALGFSFFLISCNTTEKSPDVSAIKVNVNIERLDETLMKLENKDQIIGFLQKNRSFVNQFFQTSPQDTSLISWINLIVKDKKSQEFYRKVKGNYGDMSDLKSQFEMAFKHLKYYYPDFKEPKIITTFSGFANDLSVSDSLIIIGLESFLGPKSKERPQQPNYILTRYDKPYIVPTVVAFLSKKYNRIEPTDRTMLADMVYYGKSFAFTKAMIPNIADSLVIGYPDSTLINTTYAQDLVWAHFIDKKLLYETNDRIKEKYLAERPKTTEIGPACPGKIGQWVGWQIINHYRTEKPDISLQDLMKNQNARQIFEESKYRGQGE